MNARDSAGLYRLLDDYHHQSYEVSVEQSSTASQRLSVPEIIRIQLTDLFRNGVPEVRS